jgi:hypothetical protein
LNDPNADDQTTDDPVGPSNCDHPKDDHRGAHHHYEEQTDDLADPNADDQMLHEQPASSQACPWA